MGIPRLNLRLNSTVGTHSLQHIHPLEMGGAQRATVCPILKSRADRLQQRPGSGAGWVGRTMLWQEHRAVSSARLGVRLGKVPRKLCGRPWYSQTGSRYNMTKTKRGLDAMYAIELATSDGPPVSAWPSCGWPQIHPMILGPSSSSDSSCFLMAAARGLMWRPLGDLGESWSPSS